LSAVVGIIQLRRRNNSINRWLVLGNYYRFYFSQLLLILHLSYGRRKWEYNGTGLQHCYIWRKPMMTEGRIVQHFNWVWCACETSCILVTACFKETCNKADVDNTCMLHFLFRMSWKKEILYCYCIVTLLWYMPLRKYKCTSTEWVRC
jgi:hypothetical protein